MHAFQHWLLRSFQHPTFVSEFMVTKYGWPMAETLHFLALSLLIGTIGMFDLRLLGMGKRIPIGALHKLIPWGVSGYIVSVLTGLMFLMTEPDQYIYNPSFHLKVLFMGLAGLNVATFYSGIFRRVKMLPSGEDAALSAKVIAAASLLLWTGVIVFGRMLTFYRPGPCDLQTLKDFALTCLP